MTRRRWAAMTGVILWSLFLWTTGHGQTQDRTAERLDRALKAAGVPIVGVSIGDPANRATWTVQPPSLQGAAQPTIDAFDPTATEVVVAEVDQQTAALLDALSDDLITAILEHFTAIAAEASAGTLKGNISIWKQRLRARVTVLRRAK